MLVLLGEAIAHFDARLKELETKLLAIHRAHAISQLLATIPGIGPIIALTLAIEIDPKAFQSGRHIEAWLGLTPREHSTGASNAWVGSAARAMNDCGAAGERCHRGDPACQSREQQAGHAT
jgi:transposase